MRELVIGDIGGQGDGLGRDVDGGGPFFAPLTLPGERVLAEMVGGRAEAVKLLEPSAERVLAPCPHFGACGGCALQHWRSAPYLEWKRRRIAEVLARDGLSTNVLAPFSPPSASRRRLVLHARRIDGGVRLGFKARRSWRLVPIDTCLIAVPGLNAAMPALTALADPFLEHPASAPSLHVTWTETGLDVDVSGVEAKSGGLSADARSEVGRLAAAADLARVTLAGEAVYQARTPLIRFGRVMAAPPPGAFLQASAAAEAAMAAFVVEQLAGATSVIDLFCGVGAFTFRMAEKSSVTAVDGSAPAVAALIAARGSADGLRPIEAKTRDLERRPLSQRELAAAQAVVFDPPRAGALAQAAEIARSDVGRVIALSCNPTTFARDARVLVDGGYRLERVLPVDQFVWSPHIELVAVFTKARRRG